MQIASQAKTVGRTGRLTGFEIEKDSHEGISFISPHEGPLRYVPSCRLGQQSGIFR